MPANAATVLPEPPPCYAQVRLRTYEIIMNSSHPRQMVQQLAQRFAGRASGPAAMTERVPVSHYTDPQHFQRELQTLFLQRPLVLCHETQLAQQGDAIVQDWLGIPMITVRDKQGAINTFINVCRHRGMRLVPEQGQACLRSLVCPYHQWTYGLDGALRNIPRQESFADLDKKQLGLVTLPTAVRNGLVWVQPTPGKTMDIDTHLAGLGEDLDFFQLGAFSYCQQSVRNVDANWKLIQDAFLDGYHVARLHKHTVGPFFPDALAESNFIGDHLRNAVARNEIEEAVDLPAEQLGDLRRYATFSYTTFPNSVLIFHPEYISIIALFPQSADSTVFVHTMLTPDVPADEAQRDHFLRSFQLIDEGVFAAEDIFAAAGTQQGLRSGANDALIFGGLEEAAVRFHNLIARELA
ncbi:ferredoxin [Pseudohalioglobus lutimaris]|uniref:Ferredoxin n=2 Tax=Pseudohalioglobus lutimaris TaxID=1737061 RepID=A0A2N5X087_9GAMM|nr:ferredoxin [Pseudohalioglobus lutimaris]